MRKWYKRRGGWVPRTPRVPWVRKPGRRTPVPAPTPIRPPIRTIPMPMPPLVPARRSPMGRTYPMPKNLPYLPLSRRKGRGRKVNKETRPETQPMTGPEVSPETDTMPRQRQRRYLRPPKVRIRTPWGTILRRNKPRRASSTRIKPMGTGTTMSLFKQKVKYNNFKRKVAIMSPRQAQMTTSGSRVTWSYREQGYYEYMVGTRADMLSIVNNVPSFSDLTKIFARNCILERYISNQSNANCYIKLYEVAYKRSVGDSVSGLINSGLSDLGTAATVTTYGITPAMAHPTTKPFIRVLRMYNVELAAGRTHKHTSVYEFNKEWNHAIYDESAVENLSGWTRGLFILAHGEPVNDTTTKSKVVPSSGAIDIVTKQTWNYYYGTPNKPSLEYFTVLPTGTITESVMEAATDQTSTVETA